jgi:hypothetical protein
MVKDFQEQLAAARKAGKVAAKRSGQTVKALVLRLMDEGAAEPISILVAVLEKRGECPAWLAAAPRHELAAVLAAWGSVRHVMRGHKKATS